MEIAIDPGTTSSGIVVFNTKDNNLFVYSALTLHTKPLNKREKQKSYKRAKLMFEKIIDIIQQYNITTIYIEPYHVRGPRKMQESTPILIGMLLGWSKASNVSVELIEFIAWSKNVKKKGLNLEEYLPKRKYSEHARDALGIAIYAANPKKIIII